MEPLSFADTLSQFHFIRIHWLWALIPSAIIAIALFRMKQQNNQWQNIINPKLLPFLLDGQHSPARKLSFVALALTWAIAIIALAGPSWEKIPLPVHKSEKATAIIMDLSPSMLAEDVSPSRLIRTRFKIEDFLTHQQEGLYSLIAFAGEAYTITPLTDDSATIINILPSMHPGNLPISGSNVEMAIERALALFDQAQIQQGDIMLFTDGITKGAQRNIDDLLGNSAHRLSILGIGTNDGAPIPKGNGSYLRNNTDNSIIVAKLDSANLKRTATAHRGRYNTITADNSDIQYLSNLPVFDNLETRQLEREFDTWQDKGVWLCWLLIPIALFCFKRGQVAVIALVLSAPFIPQDSYAFGWNDLWKTPDQQGKEALEEGDLATAIEKFENPAWKGVANYRAGNYDEASELFSEETVGNLYNRGTALARAGKLQEALDTYDQALELQPEHEDTLFNREIVEQMLKQQQQDQQNQSSENSDNQEQGEEQSEQDRQANDTQSNQGQNGEEQQSEQNQQQNADQSQDASESEKEQSEQDQTSGQGEQQEEGEQEQKEQANAEEGNETDENQPPQDVNANAENTEHDSELSNEEQQQLETWLRQVPDNPDGLIINKLKHQRQELRRQYHQGEWTPPENGAMERW